MTAPTPWTLAWSDTSVTILDANGAPVGLFPNDGRADAQSIIDVVNTTTLTDLRAERNKALANLAESTKECYQLRLQLERVRQTVLIAFDDGFFAGNAGRNWDGTHAWNTSRAKVRLENEGLSTEMPKEVPNG